MHPCYRPYSIWTIGESNNLIYPKIYYIELNQAFPQTDHLLLLPKLSAYPWPELIVPRWAWGTGPTHQSLFDGTEFKMWKIASLHGELLRWYVLSPSHFFFFLLLSLVIYSLLYTSRRWAHKSLKVTFLSFPGCFLDEMISITIRLFSRTGKKRF